MRKALTGILLAAAAATPAFAQDSEQQQRWQQRFEQNQARNQARSEARNQRQESRSQSRQEVREVPQARQAVRAERHQERRQESAGQGGYPDGWNNVDPNDRRAVRARERYLEQAQENRREAHENRERREWRDQRRAEHRWDRYRWRNDRRYDWYSYRNNYRDLYRGGRYYDPYGYGYRRFRVGIQIGSPFYSSRYRIHDPYRYRLPHAGPGYAWVRYYNDVLLVDTWNGEVVDVIYDFFW